jgi:diamine N-acetyltransferase
VSAEFAHIPLRGGCDDGPVDQNTPMASAPVTLRPISEKNRNAVVALRVAAAQEAFVDGVAESLAEAAATPEARPWYRAVYAGDTSVGFVMLSDDVAAGNRAYPWRYYLWRLLIDARLQGRGYGHATLDLVVEYVRTRPGAAVLVTSAVPGDGSPLEFYLRYGFRDTGNVFEDEHVLHLPLT